MPPWRAALSQFLHIEDDEQKTNRISTFRKRLSGSCERDVATGYVDNIVMHKFSVGQTVNLIPRVLRSAAAGEYEIRHLMPAPDTDPETPRYRIKNIAEKHERVASESDLTLSN